ncbi:competence damage-inducible protein A [Spiroplasma sp. TIUS-1]|uniref:CinA family protein n=1 Tax=Spiroplasma sp. TIUS-1 TaxID=216963 RepID=UPI0013992CBD|nr:nicotinamide-nucleotide amidohydrolase family protein [Spiroplasma sp. TIUS-1]QHX35827.1 competence damage-inducible protein A [Spiroplasma sp. TIUS-1]
MERLIEWAINNNYSISTCESFTGGAFSNALTNVSGSSKAYKGGFVCYSNEFKVDVLKIDIKVIKKYSPVSVEVLTEMLNKTQKILLTDIVIGYTGWAPPLDKKNSDSGLTYYGFKIKDEITIIEYKLEANMDRSHFKTIMIEKLIKQIEKRMI